MVNKQGMCWIGIWAVQSIGIAWKHLRGYFRLNGRGSFPEEVTSKWTFVWQEVLLTPWQCQGQGNLCRGNIAGQTLTEAHSEQDVHTGGLLASAGHPGSTVWACEWRGRGHAGCKEATTEALAIPREFWSQDGPGEDLGLFSPALPITGGRLPPGRGCNFGWGSSLRVVLRMAPQGQQSTSAVNLSAMGKGHLRPESWPGHTHSICHSLQNGSRPGLFEAPQKVPMWLEYSQQGRDQCRWGGAGGSGVCREQGRKSRTFL